MPDFIKYSFTGGVFSPEFHGRPDVEKYESGLADGLNFFIDYRGGVTTRAGTEFTGMLNNQPVRMFSFSFNADIGNNYLLVFLPKRLLLIQNGAFVLHDAVSASSSSNIITSANHGMLEADHVSIEENIYVVAEPTENTFRLNLANGDPASFPDGNLDFAPLYTIRTPYTGPELSRLTATQRRNSVFLTINSRFRRELKRTGSREWSLGAVQIVPDIKSPTNLTHANDGSGNASWAWSVTAVDEEGRESVLSSIAVVKGATNHTTEQGSPEYRWNRVSSAVAYRVYRSIVFPTGTASADSDLGFIGEVTTPYLVDSNITPDFTRAPRKAYSPFSDLAIYSIEVTNGGSGYSNAEVSVTNPSGTGYLFSAVPIIKSGSIVAVKIINPGAEYINPQVVFTGDGSGATGIAKQTPDEGNSPSTSAFWLQAHWYAGTLNNPIGLYSSASGDPFNFSPTQSAGPSSPQSLTIDTNDLTPIRHLGVLGSQLVVFSGAEIWAISQNDQGKFAALNQTNNGISEVPPIFIGREALYVQNSGDGVWALSPTNVPGYLVDNDRALFSPHLVNSRDPIVSWAYAKIPYRIIWAATKSGKLLSLTYVAEQNVYAWAPHETQGFVRAVSVALENGRHVPYLAVQRNNGLTFERFVDREFHSVEDVWSVDCALALRPAKPAFNLTVTPTTLETSEDFFLPEMLGQHVRFGSGRVSITAILSPRSASYIIDIDTQFTTPQSFRDPVALAGEWSIGPRFKTIRNLEHLEGEVVQMFGDGKDYGSAQVVNGSVELNQPASLVVVGLGFNGHITTLPPSATDAVIEHKLKRVVSVAARTYKTRGLGYGTPQTSIYTPNERSNERLQEPTRLNSNYLELPLLDNYNKDGSVTFYKKGPMCASILNIVMDMEISDD